MIVKCMNAEKMGYHSIKAELVNLESCSTKTCSKIMFNKTCFADRFYYIPLPLFRLAISQYMTWVIR